ncbi:MAG TPA: hypothetical protein VHQ20_02000 [Patescibacteria group bacterium]|jgi:hypothetical protein|nr:hypothetical protein [Patescibacteria group bacterium]
MAKTIYLNLEDDVTKVVNKLKREKAVDVVLVFPKQSYVFSDGINMRLLKKQLDMLGKNISILTMDERGKAYAEEAGFALKSMPRSLRANSLSDIRPRTAPAPVTITEGFAKSPAPTEAELAVATASAVQPKLKKRRVIPADASAAAPAAAALAVPATMAKSPTRIRKISTSSAPSTHSKETPDSATEFFTPVEKSDNVFIPPTSKLMKPPKRRRSYRAYVVGFVSLVLVVILLLVLVVLPSANITVYAKSQSVARDLDVIADSKAENSDSSNLTIPAVIVNQTKSATDTFQVNGKKEVGSKAEGRVALYNLTGQPMALKAATTTLTVGSKSYTFKSDQPVVKALTSPSNDANATVADIVASDGGESFNLPAGTRMEITNQAFGSKPQKLYAKTVTQVVGGNSRFVSVVSKDDLDNAQKELVKRTVDGINSGLTNQSVKLVDGAYTINVTSFTPDKPVDTEATNFTAQLNVTITGLAFDETGLKNLIRQRILGTLGNGKDLQSLDADSIIYKISNLDTTNGVMQLSIHYESNAKPQIDANDLKNKISGKSKQEASDLILANPDVDRIEITIQPAWQSSLPRFTSKIHMDVKE